MREVLALFQVLAVRVHTLVGVWGVAVRERSRGAQN
jgi:hypothetical protein